MENNMLCARLMIHTIYGFSLPADIFPFVFTDSEKSTSFVVYSGERFVISLSVKKNRRKKRIVCLVMAVFTGYNFYIMKNFSLIVVGILFIYCVSSCRKQVDKGFEMTVDLSISNPYLPMSVLVDTIESVGCNYLLLIFGVWSIM